MTHKDPNGESLARRSNSLYNSVEKRRWHCHQFQISALRSATIINSKTEARTETSSLRESSVGMFERWLESRTFHVILKRGGNQYSFQPFIFDDLKNQ